MTIDTFSEALYEDLELLSAQPELPSAEESKNNYFIILELVGRLKEFVTNYTFENLEKEINFFRNIKPKFLSVLIYYRKIFDLQSNTPMGLPGDVKIYYLDELEVVKHYLTENREFLNYYRSGSSFLDDKYFTRQQPDLWLSLNSENCCQDDCATVYDHRLSKLLAYERVIEFLLKSISKISDGQNELSVIKTSVTWTAPKAALIELLYAIQTNGACNNGVIDVKQLAAHFENLFNVKLGNFYRTFQELRIRKISRTTFLDHLKEGLIKRMDDSDENPRF